MIIDRLYKTVQEILNKEQLGYLKPLAFNLFVNTATRKITNKSLVDLKSNQRKENWFLEGKNLANLTAHTRQLVEYFSEVTTLSAPYTLPDDADFVEDVFKGNKRVDKVDYAVLLDLRRNIYAQPTECTPKASLVGRKLVVLPDNLGDIELHYLRRPKVAKWTYIEYQGKPLFDATAQDFQDVDLPEVFFDDLVSIVVELASKQLRELDIAQLEQAEQNQENQLDNR